MKWTKTKKLLAVVLTMAMLLPAGGLLVSADIASWFASPASSEPVENLAQDKTPSVNNGNSYDVPGHFDLAYLTDGTTDRAWHSSLTAAPASESNPTILTVDLCVIHTLSAINLRPYTGSAYETSVMPRDYRVEVFSADEGQWITVASEQNVTLEGDDALTYELDEVKATAVRLVITKDSAYRPSTADSYISVVGEMEIIGLMSQEWNVYPVPMEATYGKQVINLAEVNLQGDASSYDDRLEEKGVQVSANGVDVWVEYRTLSEFEYGAEEGYVLTIDADGVKIETQTATGLHYAMMTLLQLLADGTFVPYAVIKDAPRNEWRGVIEGFYGEPWTDDYRKDLFAFMGDNKLNAYIYAPKDDAKHRDEWRTTYTTTELARLQALVDTAKANNVKFIYAIAPGLDFGFSSWGTSSFSNEFKKLTAKCQQLYDIGVRDFAILLDDIPESQMNGKNHAKLLNQFQKDFVEAKGDVSPLIAVTAEYCDAFLTDGIGDGYTTNLINADLDEDIVLMWTGVGVNAFYNDNSTLSSIKTTYGREVLMWWNYPCNDYAANNLFMDAFGNLANDTYQSMVGLVANPMNQGYASMVPLFTTSDFLWNPDVYDATASLEAACKAIMPDADLALQDFVSMNSANVINNYTDSTQLKKLLDAFRRSYSAKDRNALKAYFESMVENADAIAASENQKLAAELGDWLEKYRTYGEMGLAYIAAEEAYAAKQDQSIIQGYVDEFNTLKQSLADNERIVSGSVISTPVAGSGGGDVLGSGVLTAFYDNLDARFDRLLPQEGSSAEPTNVAKGQSVTIDGTTYLNFGSWTPSALVDGVKSSQEATETDNGLFMTPESHITASNPADVIVSLDGVYEISALKIFRGHGTHATAMPRAYTLDVSEDGSKWTTVVTVTAAQTEGDTTVGDRAFTLAKTAVARYVRIHITQDSGWDLTSMGYGWTTVVGELEAWGVPYTGETAAQPSNVAVGQVVTVENSTYLDFGSWTPGALVDGVKPSEAATDNGIFLTPANRASASNPVNVIVTLDDVYEISILKIFRGHAGENTYMPKAYTLDVSEDGIKWDTVATATAAQTADDRLFALAETAVAKYVRIRITQDSGVDLTAASYGWSTVIGELEIWGVPYAGEPEPEGPEIFDVALGQTVSATAGHEDGTTWSAQFLVAGNKSTGGGWLDMSGAISTSNAPVITITLDDLYTIYSVDLYPVNAFNDAYISVMPQEFIIQLSSDGGRTWKTVATETGVQSQVAGIPGHWYSDGKPAVNQPYCIELEEPTAANMMRMTITKGGSGSNPDQTAIWGSDYAPYTSIGSIEMMGIAGVLENEDETETDVEIETETEFEVNFDELEFENVAYNAYVTTTAGQTHNADAWGDQRLTDGLKVDDDPSSGGLLLIPNGDMFGPVTTPIDITLNLGGRYAILAVDLYSAYEAGVALPQGYIFSVSDDGINFTPVATITDGDQYESSHSVEFEELAIGYYLRITITNGCDADWTGAGQSFCAIGELEAWGVPAHLVTGEPEDGPGSEPGTESGPANVAPGKPVSVNNDNTLSVPESGWDISYLTDGRSDNAWHSLSGSSASAPTIITIDLGGVCDVSSVNLTPYTGSFYDTSVLPRDYRIEALSPEHEGWVVLGSATNMVDVNGDSLIYTGFGSVKVTQVRIVITKDSAANVSVIGELEIYGTPYTGEVETNHTCESTYDPATGVRTYSACSLCGKTPATFTTVWSRDVLVNIDEDLKMYFYAWIDESVVDPTLRVTRDDREYVVAGTVVSTVGDAVEYEFVFEGVTPQYADAALTAELWCSGYKLLAKNCSLQQYIADRKEDVNIAPTESNMLSALDTYFAALENAQFGTDNDVNVDGFTNVTATDKKVNDNGNLATFNSATVGFGNDIRIRFILTLADGVNAADLTFKTKINVGAETEVDADLIKISGSIVTIYTDAIAASDLDDVYTVTVYNGETAGASFVYSVKSYVYSFQSATGASEEQVLLVKALYNYGLSAKAYTDAQ